MDRLFLFVLIHFASKITSTGPDRDSTADVEYPPTSIYMVVGSSLELSVAIFWWSS